MSSSTSPHVGHHPYFSQDRDSVQKTFRSCDRSRHSCQDFLKKRTKRREGIVPWVAPEQGVSLHWCKDTRCLASNTVANS
jgi:hypothetical protein